ncbi:MAG: ferritin-like protein, partial [Cyclobacteriaceae bacterium]
FSIHPEANRECFAIIHSVYMEEMLHLLLAANVMTAINGSVKLSSSNVPAYPLKLEFRGENFRDREFDINLERLSPDAIDTFMKIELPADWEEPIDKMMVEVTIPGYTIGEFYELIKKLLTDYCKEIGEENVFTGDPAWQVGEDFYWQADGKPIVVTNLEQALEAIDIIVEQGEGASAESVLDGDRAFFGQPEEVAHFFRFNEIKEGRRYKPDDDPHAPPTGKKLAVDYDKVFPIKKNCSEADFANTPKLRQLNLEFNKHFTLMLKGMEKAFNGYPKELYPAIMNDMHGMVKIANEMVQVPIAGDPEDRTGAPTFEYINLPF